MNIEQIVPQPEHDPTQSPTDLQSNHLENPKSSFDNKKGEDDKRKWITLPQLGESATEGRLMLWLKQPGDWVEKYEPIAEVETDKVTTEIPSPFSGFFKGFVVDPDTSVPFGAPICWIEEGQQAQEAASNAVEKEEEENKELRDENEDEEKIVDDESSHQKPQHPKHSQPPKPIPFRSIDHPAIHIQKPDEQPIIPVKVFPGDEIIPHTSMRRAIAEHMVRSERTAPHATAVMETDMTNVVNYRNHHKDKFLQKEGIDLTYLPFAIKAATLALRDNPRLNAVFDEDRIILRKAKNIGIAVALEDGLIVPVIKNADRLSIAGLAHTVSELTIKAREGMLTPDDVTGGTFTVNNPGTFGTLVSTPIIVQPQVGILSTEAIIKRPVVIDDNIAARYMMNLSLSIDHRAIDGLYAARFLKRVKELLEGVNEETPLY
ncbi:MAG: 2-oxo acid dehydrogenase subunit E2 [Candidatus Levybacteria bacterium]|nr:2-oxo acid dehydrogenase subunit E2 [Candidatus Levybacteria bacterium]